LLSIRTIYPYLRLTSTNPPFGDDAHRESRHRGLDPMSLRALSCIILKLFRCIAALFLLHTLQVLRDLQADLQRRMGPRGEARHFGNSLVRRFQY